MCVLTVSALACTYALNDKHSCLKFFVLGQGLCGRSEEILFINLIGMFSISTQRQNNRVGHLTKLLHYNQTCEVISLTIQSPFLCIKLKA